MKINRFLALIGYIEGQPLDSVLSWQGHLTVHDDYFLSKGHSPGTLRSALLAIRPFLRWCKDEGHATQHKAEQVRFSIAFYCIMSIDVFTYAMHYLHIHLILI